MKEEIDSNAIIVGDFNTLFPPTDRSSKQKINKETQVLNDTLDEMDIIDIFRTFHPNAECCSHALQETNSLRRTVQIVECSLLHQRAQGRVSS